MPGVACVGFGEQTPRRRCLKARRGLCRRNLMFEDSLIESDGRLRTKRGLTTVLSFALQVMLIGVLVLIPLLFTEALPKTQLIILVAPPPPPPAPPQAAAP